jgi:hypothetical protein
MNCTYTSTRNQELSTIGEESPLVETEMLHDDGSTSIRRKHRRFDPEALHFAARLAVVLTVCSLFDLLRSPKYHSTYPNGTWVIISALFVSWFPTSRDAASVLEKIVQRWTGTVIGAALGITCGFLSMMLANRPEQAAFLACSMLVVTFCVVSLAGQVKVGRVMVIERYSYATLLCMSTFCICMMPFGLDGPPPKWKPGVFRILNVTLGCVIAGLGAMLVYPRSTRDVLYEKTSRQVTLAGEASKAVLLTAAEAFAGRIKIPLLSRIIMDARRQESMTLMHAETGLDEHRSYQVLAEVALQKYEDAISDWKASKALFPLLPFDPFSLFGEPADAAFTSEMATTLSRALRIQATVVVLDGMVRNQAECDFSEETLLMFAETGTLIRQMLTLPLEAERSTEAARELFDKLEQTRKAIIEVSCFVTEDANRRKPLQPILEDSIMDFKSRLLHMDTESIRMDDDMGRG